MGTVVASKPAAPDELHRMQYQQQAILDCIADMVWLKDEDGRFVVVNAAYGRSCGLSPAAVVGKTDYDVWPRELAEQYQHDDQLVMATCEQLQIEEPLEEYDGRRRWIEATKRPYFDAAGRVAGTIGVARDIDARKKAEEALRASETNYRELVESANSIILRINASGRILFCNEFAVRFFGYERDELIGQLVVDTIVPRLESTGRNLQEMVANVCGEPSRYALNENENITKSGRRVWVSWANKTLTMAEGHEPEILCVGQDMTEKRHLQSIMLETEKMATIGGLAAGMAHELNNPLGAIIQSVQNLSRRLAGSLAANEQTAAAVGIDFGALQQYLERRGIFEMLAHITSAGTRAADIIAKMLAFSQKAVIGRTSVQLVDLMERALDLAACDYDLKKRYNFRNLTITRNYDPAMPAVVANRSEIEQVMFNLLKNAAQALALCPANRQPQIAVKIGTQDGFAIIEVADNGPGIVAADRAHIFDPFFTTKQVGDGTGLGLSVAYAIVVQHHQGSIQVESADGEGARFTVRLPYERNDRSDTRLRA